MRGLARDLAVYSVVHTIALLSLALLGETHIDAYTSVSILTYLISTSLLPGIRRYSDLRVMDLILIIIFIITISYRVMKILGVSLVGVTG